MKTSTKMVVWQIRSRYPKIWGLGQPFISGAVKSDLGNARRENRGQSLGKTAGLGWVPVQTTPASSRCQQLCRAQPEWAQRSNASSVPVQRTSSSRMGPVPGPKRQRPGALRARPQPSRRHTTRAFLMFQWSSHTVPHTPWCQTSTRPSQRLCPPARRRGGSAGGKSVSQVGRPGEQVPTARRTPGSLVFCSRKNTGANSMSACISLSLSQNIKP